MNYIKRFTNRQETTFVIIFEDDNEQKVVRAGEASPKVIKWRIDNDFTIVEFPQPELSDYQNAAIFNMSQLAFTKRSTFLPDYKRINALEGIYDVKEPQAKAKYKKTVQAFRTEFYRLKAAIEVTGTLDEVDNVVKTENYPTEILT